EDPGECDLGRRRAFALRDALEELDEDAVGSARIRGESGNRVAEIGALERGRLVDGAREEALPERAERHEADAELLERRQDRLLRLAPPERIFALQGGDGLNGVCAPDRLHARLRE